MGNVTKVTLGGFKWVENTSEFNKDIENYNEEIDIEYFLEIDVQYPKNFLELPNDLRFSPEIMKIGKVKKLLTNLYDKKGVVHVQNLKSYIDLNTEQRKIEKMISKKIFQVNQ